jgi:hypothetical protein
MTGQTAGTDERILREALIVVRSARERAPTDFLVALAVVLGGAAFVLVALGLTLNGTLGDLCLNLGAEVAGAWLTVVLVDGLWSRQQTGAAERLRRIEGALQERAAAGTELSTADRDGWRSFIAEYGQLTARSTLLDRVRAARGYGARAHRLEKQGELLLGIEI